jgi:hypothetical protein
VMMETGGRPAATAVVLVMESQPRKRSGVSSIRFLA